MLLISAIILFDALSVGMVVNAFGHANSLQLTTLRPKLNSRQLPFFEPVKLLDYLTYFDKIDGAADIMIISDILDTLNPTVALGALDAQAIRVPFGEANCVNNARLRRSCGPKTVQMWTMCTIISAGSRSL